MPHQVPDIYERSVPQLLLGKQRAALIVQLIQLGQDAEHLHAIVQFEQFDHLSDVDLGIGWVGRYFLEEDLVDVDQQLAF